MLTRARIDHLREAFGSDPGPVLSVYVRIPPGERADVIEHVKTALDRAQAPQPLAERAMAALVPTPRGRTMATFVGTSVFEGVALDVELPLPDPREGRAVARITEGPWLLPLEMAWGRAPVLGILHVGRERCRMLRIHLDAVEEVLATDRMPHAGYETTPASRQTPEPGGSAPARDDAHLDRKQHHEADLRDRMYREVINRLPAVMNEHRMETLLVLGTPRSTAAFLDLLPRALAERTVPGTTRLSEPQAPPERILAELADEVGALARWGQETRLEQVEERGVSGLEAVLRRAQEGGVERILVPWTPSETVFRSPDGYLAVRPEHAESPTGEAGAAEAVSLEEALDALIPRFGITVEAVDGVARDRLEADHAGIAAMTRW